MKKMFLKAGSVTSIAVGASLMSLPALATWSRCITDGGFHNPVIHDTCTLQNDRDPVTGTITFWSTGSCLGKQVPKGYYCDDQGDGIKCESRPKKHVQIQRFEGTCMVTRWDQVEGGALIPVTATSFTLQPNQVYPNYTPACVAGAWFTSSETEEIGQCAETGGT